MLDGLLHIGKMKSKEINQFFLATCHQIQQRVGQKGENFKKQMCWYNWKFWSLYGIPLSTPFCISVRTAHWL